MKILTVSGRSRPGMVAGAIAGVIREGKEAKVQAIGAAAVHQAIKAVIIARRYLAEEYIDAVCIPTFIDVEIDRQERTAIQIIVEPR